MINEKFLEAWWGSKLKLRVKEESAFACCALIYNVKSSKEKKSYLAGINKKKTNNPQLYDILINS